MKHHFYQLPLATAFTLCLFSISQPPVQAAPGNIGQIPLFVAPPVQPNIFFMLDDSGSMDWTMPSDGVSGSLIDLNLYDTNPDDDKEWRAWCLGANFLAYNPKIKYKPWAANKPGTTTPFPDQTDLHNVWVNPLESGSTISFKSGENNGVRGGDNEIIDLAGAPVVQWTDSNNDGLYDAGECPGGGSESGYKDNPLTVKRADSLSAAEQINFANWFSYYRTREYTTKAAVTQVISNSSARMGMATLHHNNNVGVAIKDMTVTANKNALLEDVVKINSSGGTPLRTSLDNVGEYYKVGSNAPPSLNIGSASSPILPSINGGECQQNFTMLMTDGQWNGSPPGVTNQDGAPDSNFVYPAHQDANEDTLADVAMKWYKTDLAPTFAPKVPVQTLSAGTPNPDENKQQHMVTFGIAFGPNGTIDNDPVNRAQSFNWPAPTANSVETVDDLRHAAYNGRGKFLSANNPETLIASLQKVISDIESRQGSAAAVSFNTSTLAAGTSLFFASFNTEGWSGDVEAYTVNPNTGTLSASPIWSAADILDSKTNAEMFARTVYTWGVDSAGANNGVLFDWSETDPQPAANILGDIKTNLDLSADSSPFVGSKIRLNHLRGDTSQDSAALTRDRENHRLGDIIHSASHFVGAPVSNWPDHAPFGSVAKRYSGYQADTQASSRDGVVYVGANDGMLHGFNTRDGEEVLAYLPSAPASALDNAGLHYLTEVDYQHRYYVDGSPVSADVFMPIETSGASDWRTILIGTLGGGGQGLYALDVTDPNQYGNTQLAAKNTVLWEFTNQDDDHLGYSFSTPQLTMMNNSKWAVVIGNGYNATGTDKAELIILFIEKGIDGQWTLDADYIRIETPEGSSANKNGLSTPALIDLDGNGTTDRIYAGDLLGNMWAFDVSNSTASNWGIAHQNASSDPEPLFKATHYASASTDPGTPVSQVSATPQPITMKPLLVKPDTGWVSDDATNAPNIMVYFGTGQYIATGDAVNINRQTFYGVWDAGVSVPGTKLVEQTFVPGVPINARVVTRNPVDFPVPPILPADSPQLGWFINLPELGERVVVDAFEFAGLIFFNTMTPSSEPCSAGGESWLMAVDMKTGGNPEIGAFDFNGDGEFDHLDKVSDGTNEYYVAGKTFGHGIASATSVITNDNGKSFAYTSGTDGVYKDILPGGATGRRRSWIQLFN